MKRNFKLGGILLIITMISGLLLGFANDLTKEAIIENSKISKEDLNYIMPAAEKIQDTTIELDSESGIKEIYEAVTGNDVIGYVFKVTSKGFHGAIDFVVGISKDDKVTGIKVLAHNETPGLGAKITEDKFTERFKDKPATDYLEVVKVTPNKDTEVEAISGATSSSKASVHAVNEAITFYLENIRGEVVEPQENTDADTGASAN
ncbi:RnfABCDGE type electron transport complex subunit G [Clostridium sp. AL.422]|uniref:RnfABCDGE type electron transport complex subunit G n=1 Tax=Clostridium TaxID=1485 RepID=UPI00293DCC73|nr:MULTISPECIES: RnfABCDGE type electron transport complex subunit G [unclassified Clostridium]MDV4149616.1 RnfABCDGE type electron transport complex subunit G [Clostridium sp. AL.422]